MEVVLFCENPAEPGKVDPDFEAEYNAAKNNGFNVILFDFDELSYSGNATAATKKIKQAAEETRVIYRGWMLSPEKYKSLYETLLAKNYRLVNNPAVYRTCHYLPENLPFIENITPQTVFEKLDATQDLNGLLAKTKIFGNRPVIIKDYVKSEKHNWETACFVPNASDEKKLAETMKNFLDLRGKYLNEGIVVRAFEELKQLSTHSKSGMPLAMEYRLFFFNQKLISVYDYWEEGAYTAEKPATTAFEKTAQEIPSAFFTMDIAQKTNGEWIVVELGDGQVSGLPDAADKTVFYQQLKALLND